MTSPRLSALITAAIFSALPFCACAQSADLPAAPTALPTAPTPAVPSTPIFQLPLATPLTVASPKWLPPSPPETETDDCYAAAKGIYAKRPKLPPAVQKQVDFYDHQIMHEISFEWDNHMPLAAQNAWLKGRMLAVRFAIMPDGSIDTPEITMSSGRRSYDDHALDAIKASAPFAPLPEGLKRPLPFCIRFAYNVNPSTTESKPPDLWPPPAKPDAKKQLAKDAANSSGSQTK